MAEQQFLVPGWPAAGPRRPGPANVQNWPGNMSIKQVLRQFL